MPDTCENLYRGHRTVMQLQSAKWDTLCETLPTNRPWRSLRPRAPITMRSAFRSFAQSRITSAGSPSDMTRSIMVAPCSLAIPSALRPRAPHPERAERRLPHRWSRMLSLTASIQNARIPPEARQEASLYRSACADPRQHGRVHVVTARATSPPQFTAE